MRYLLLGSFICSACLFAEEMIVDRASDLVQVERIEDATWRAYYTALELQQKEIAVQIAQMDKEFKGELSGLSEIQGSLTQYAKEIAELKVQSKQLLLHIVEKEKGLVQATNQLEELRKELVNVKGEVAKTEARETQHQSRYQAMQARIDNLSQQLDDMHRKLSGKKK